MKKSIWILAIFIMCFSVNAFGQSNKKTSRIAKPDVQKISRNMDDFSDGNYRKNIHRKRKKVAVLPEVNDEVIVAFRKKQTAKTSTRRKSNKYANQEVSYRKRKITKQRRKNK